MKRALVNILSVIGAIVIIGGTAYLVTLPMKLEREHEAETLANMHTVQLGAEDFGVQNDGQYAAGVDVGGDHSSYSLIQLLPKHLALTNPFTGARSEPRLGPARPNAPPGSVWYEPVRDSTGYVANYRITGVGRHGVLPEILRSGPEGNSGR
jgi:hypothetical protein